MSLILLPFNYLSAQNVSDIPDKSIRFHIGSARLGTGDIKGIVQSIEFEKYFRRKLSWSAEIGSSVHSSSFPEFVTIADGQKIDMSYRYTIAGLQLSGKAGYSFIRTNKSNFGLKVGALLRYQSSSLADEVATYYPGGTGLPFPALTLTNSEPQNTYALGGSFQLFYNYAIRQNILLGLNTGFQADTNGDTMFPQLCLTIGYRF